MLKLKNIGPYVDEQVDFSQLEGDIVSIVGENGAGKTMLIDSVFAALYREFPSRDSIYRYCNGKAQIQFEFEADGKRYQSVINIDPKKREMEPWLFEGENALTDGRAVTFDEAVRRIVGPPNHALASTYSAQNKAGSFLSLPKAKRKELFIDMLGLGKLQVVSDLAADREKRVKVEYEAVGGMVDSLNAFINETGDVDLEALYKKRDSARDDLGTAETDVKLQSYEIGLLRGKAESFRALDKRRKDASDRVASITVDINKVKKAIAEATAASANLKTLEGDAALLPQAEANFEQVKSEVDKYEVKRTDHFRRVAHHSREVKDLEIKKKEAESNVKKYRSQLERAGSDSAIISTVPCQGVGECQECQFLVNAIKARDEIADLEGNIDSYQAEVLALDAQIKGMPAPDPKQLASVEAALANLGEQLKFHEASLKKAQLAERGRVVANLAASNLEMLNQRLGSLEAELASAQTAVDQGNQEWKERAGWEASLNQHEKHLIGLESTLEACRARHTAVLDEIAKGEANKVLLDKSKIQVEKLTADLKALDFDRRCWHLLAKAFSKTGIQSLEIDAAGPIISDITNNLLFECFGPRFSIRFVTQVLKDDKSGYKDDFDIYVTDADSGREGSIDDLSGGEKVIVVEALSLAIALFNSGRVSRGWKSLWRDEASSAVDDRRAPLYVTMLRRARELGHFDKLYFIAHQQRVTEAADSKIMVANGHVTFE